MRTVTFSEPRVGKTLSKDYVCAWANRIGGFHDCDPQTERWIFRRNAEAYPTRNICTFFMTPDLQVIHYFSGYLSPDLFLEEAAFALRIREEVFDQAFAPREGAAERFEELHARRGMKLKRSARTLRQECRPPNPIRNGLAPQKEESGPPLWLQLVDGLRPLTYDKVAHDHSERCAGTLAALYDHLYGVHEDFATGGRGTGTPHALSTPQTGKSKPPRARNKGWRSVRIDVAGKKRKKKEEPKTTRTDTAVVGFLPSLSDLREDYLYGNPFAEEQSRKRIRRP